MTITDTDRRLDRMETDLRETLTEVRDMRREFDKMIARDDAREDLDTEIRRLPSRVAALENVDGSKHWTVRLVESDRGYVVIRLGLATLVLCSLALGGGLAFSDLPTVVRYFAGGQTFEMATPPEPPSFKVSPAP